MKQIELEQKRGMYDCLQKNRVDNKAEVAVTSSGHDRKLGRRSGCRSGSWCFFTKSNYTLLTAAPQRPWKRFSDSL